MPTAPNAQVEGLLGQVAGAANSGGEVGIPSLPVPHPFMAPMGPQVRPICDPMMLSPDDERLTDIYDAAALHVPPSACQLTLDSFGLIFWPYSCSDQIHLKPAWFVETPNPP